MQNVSENSLEQRARRAARRQGLLARKSRWRVNTPDNRGGFMIIEPRANIPLLGFRFELAPEHVIKYCSDES